MTTAAILFLILLYFSPLVGLICRATYWTYQLIQSMSRFIKPTQTLKEQSKLGQVIHRVIKKINHLLGKLEYYLRTPRHVLIGGALLIYLLVHVYNLVAGTMQINQVSYLFWLAPFFLLLTYYTQVQWVFSSLKIAEFARINPKLHPKSFFDGLYQLLGPFPLSLPDPQKEPTVSPKYISFSRDHRSQQTLLPLLPIVWDTATLAHISLKAMKYLGADYARPVFDVMASMWGKRVLERVLATLVITGAEKLKTIRGKNILVLTHKSQLDFILTFFALSQIQTSDGRNLKPRFITAKDHFVDNPFVYEMMGVGKLIEAVDMVFIERTSKEKSLQNLSQAARFLIEKDIDIAIFPQGTRAAGNIDRSGKRRDAGYFTTISPRDLNSDLGHLRKGCAYLALDTLIEMKKEALNEPLNLIFIGIKGNATVLARKSLKLQTEAEIEYHLGDPLTFLPDQIGEIEKPQDSSPANEAQKNYLEWIHKIHHKIDQNLIDCLDIESNLKNRFLADLQGHIRYHTGRLEQIQKSFLYLGDRAYLVYQILDRIYACPQSEWNGLLSQTAQLLLEDVTPDRLRVMRDQVTQIMLQSLKGKLHGKKIKQKKRS